MAVSELATMELGELEDKLAEARKELFNLRFQLATGQLDNSARIRHVRKEVARILTYLRQHELAEEEAGDDGHGMLVHAPGTGTAAGTVTGTDTDEDEEA
jgi:large subunit ribosomal protein L29